MSNQHPTRRRFVRDLLSTGAAASVLHTLGKSAAAQPAKPITALPVRPKPGAAGPGKKKALFIYGGWPGHEPDKCRDIFVPWMKGLGWDVVVSDNLDPYTDAALMKSVDVITQIWTMGTIKPDQQKGLLNAISNGAGLSGWHGGLGDAFRQETEYQFMVGGQWVAHPGGVIDYTVNITDHEDPITVGLNDFKVRTEQYYMHVDPNNKVLASTTFTGDASPWIDGATMPVIWKKVYGKGRVFYTSLGHNASVFNTPEALTIAQRGILWASDSKYARTPNLVSPSYPRI